MHTARANRAQSQTRAARAPRTARPPKPPLRLLEDTTLGDVLPPELLAQLESDCEQTSQNTAEALTLAISAWLHRRPLPSVVTGETIRPTTCGASTFHDLVESEMEEGADFYDTVVRLEGILGMIDRNPAFAAEAYALRLICHGTDLLTLSPAIAHNRQIHRSTGAELERFVAENGGPLEINEEWTEEALERDRLAATPWFPEMRQRKEDRRAAALAPRAA